MSWHLSKNFKSDIISSISTLVSFHTPLIIPSILPKMSLRLLSSKHGSLTDLLLAYTTVLMSSFRCRQAHVVNVEQIRWIMSSLMLSSLLARFSMNIPAVTDSENECSYHYSHHHLLLQLCLLVNVDLHESEYCSFTNKQTKQK